MIDASSLRALLGRPDVVLVDVRHDLVAPEAGRIAYARGHIPGAFFLHLDRDLSGPREAPRGRFRGRHPLPDPRAFARRLGQLGVDRDTLLVAYDERDAMFASRLWWLARWIGHERVTVLDGGLAAWREAGFDLSTSSPEPRPTGSGIDVGNGMPVIDAATLLERLSDRGHRIIDARAPERYRGEVEPLDAQAGHIPGAINHWYKLNVTEDGRFRPPGELRERFAPVLGDVRPENVVHQCGSGVSACHNMLAMAVAGLPDTVLYPGSWSEWSSLSGYPVAKGPEP